MAPPPKAKRLSLEEFPEAPAWFEPFLLVLNPFLAAITNALNRRLTRSENMLSQEVTTTFETQATPAETFPLTFKNTLGLKPKEVRVAQLQKADGGDFSAAFSMTWVNSNEGQIDVSFQGLEASTEYILTLIIDP